MNGGKTLQKTVTLVTNSTDKEFNKLISPEKKLEWLKSMHLTRLKKKKNMGCLCGSVG